MLYCPFNRQNRRRILSSRGVYVLILSLAAEATMIVGRLRTARFPTGIYLYVGSAMGPGGLAARLARHCREQKTRHWHIDYLLEPATVEAIWWQVTNERIECRWAAAALALPGASVPVARFGASDCTCRTHLVHLTTMPDATVFAGLAEVPQTELEKRLHGRSA